MAFFSFRKRYGGLRLHAYGTGDERHNHRLVELADKRRRGIALLRLFRERGSRILSEERSKLSDVREDELTDAVLTGATIYGPSDETVGTISHTHGMGAAAKVVF